MVFSKLLSIFFICLFPRSFNQYNRMIRGYGECLSHFTIIKGGSMRKSSDSASVSTEKFRSEISEEDVIAFLRAHPDFLAHHPDVVAEMVAPGRWSGDGVIDMQKFLIDRRSGEMDQLRDAAQDVIETSRSNMSVQTRTHAAVLSLIATECWEDLLRVVTQDWPLLLDVDVVTLSFEKDLSKFANMKQLETRVLPLNFIDTMIGGEQEMDLASNFDDDGTIFSAAAGLVRSAALARIRIGGNWPIGLLALGTRDDGFYPGQGTELISFLCRALESTLARVLKKGLV